MRRPICCACRLLMVCERAGVDVELMTGAAPYQIWSADLFRCPKCDCKIILWFGQMPMAEHFQEKYQSFLPTVITRFWSTLVDMESACR